MDVYGAVVIGFITSLGGGTIRDVLLGRYPIFWIADPVYIVTFLVVAVLIIVSMDAPKGTQPYVARVVKPVERFAHEDSRVFVISRFF